jgi:hypothetical protein
MCQESWQQKQSWSVTWFWATSWREKYQVSTRTEPSRLTKNERSSSLIPKETKSAEPVRTTGIKADFFATINGF